MTEKKELHSDDFNAIRLRVASPEVIHDWSHGEVLKPETINYRTQKPEKDGLFCERIFGPSKDWECYCGKYKKIRYKGIVCDKCGVEVTRSAVRRERMGHIELATPVSHIWFLRGIPSKIGLVLDLSVQSLEKVIYFASFIVTKVDEDFRDQTLKDIAKEYKAKKKELEDIHVRQFEEIQKRKADALKEAKDKKTKDRVESQFEQELINYAVHKDEQVKELVDAVDQAREELKTLRPLQIISEQTYHDLSLKYGHVFEAGIGAETIRSLLAQVDLEATVVAIQKELEGATAAKSRRLLRRLKLFKNLKKNGIRPEWMVLTALPVIPPDLRPMVPLDGGRFAASDLNDLYRRVINRNNRLKRLIDLNAPEVICRNEKRMLQEAVDALIDNGARHGKTVTASTGQKRQLKSLADMLKGKQGRFRQNLLGKRVDYSGRSVIVIGPNLKLNQCGLPKKMALELFKPFVISELIKREYVHNVRSASRFIESNRPEVWDILESITDESHVFLNRAPTLHRLGIQAFQPKLIEGKAIHVHPLVCSAFNADFDGDQMAVHVPLTEEAKREVAEIMLSSKNLLKPSTGDPVVSPSQDVVLGSYYMTKMAAYEEEGKLKVYSDPEEALLAYGNEQIGVQDPIKVRIEGEIIITTAGRIHFNDILPEGFPRINKEMNKKELKNLVRDLLDTVGIDETVRMLDAIKNFAFRYVTQSGISWGMDDTPSPIEKRDIIASAEEEVQEVLDQYEMGLLTDNERRMRVIDIWTRVKEDITQASIKTLDRTGPVFAISDSGARGSWGQITQMMGMKGLVNNPSGEIIELPVKGSFTEGFDVLEYFISTHGARKGLADTALRTANAGYLTRRLVDVSQDVVIMEEDCGSEKGFTFTQSESENIGTTLGDRVRGRYAFEDVKNPKTKEILVKKNEIIDAKISDKINASGVESVTIRSLLQCKTVRGVCKKCYGWDLGYNDIVKDGVAVGIIAAQSIGEPGTQLTMRTFHTGGVAGTDITQGLPRVEELFEARPIKHPAVLSEVDGKVKDIASGEKHQIITIEYADEKGKAQEEEVKVLPHQVLTIKKGDLVTKGQPLIEGSIDLLELYAVQGKEAVERYILKEIQYIYSSQGQAVHDKHVEVIIKQMFSRFLIENSGDTELVEGDIVTDAQYAEANMQTKKTAKAENLLLGITKVSLLTDSFLSAASFQETARVLIDAAVSGKVDKLRGLKENVIIGKLIPVGTGFRKKQKDSDKKSAEKQEKITEEHSEEVKEKIEEKETVKIEE